MFTYAHSTLIKDQYRSYALNYFDFTLLSSTKMMITKIESMTENYPDHFSRQS